MENLDWESSTRDCETWSIAVKVRELPATVSSTNGAQKWIMCTFSAFIVAEVTISLRSLLLDKTYTDMIRYMTNGAKTVVLTLP